MAAARSAMSSAAVTKTKSTSGAAMSHRATRADVVDIERSWPNEPFSALVTKSSTFANNEANTLHLCVRSKRCCQHTRLLSRKTSTASHIRTSIFAPTNFHFYSTAIAPRWSPPPRRAAAASCRRIPRCRAPRGRPCSARGKSPRRRDSTRAAASSPHRA